jgi:hypothetical protein
VKTRRTLSQRAVLVATTAVTVMLAMPGTASAARAGSAHAKTVAAKAAVPASPPLNRAAQGVFTNPNTPVYWAASGLMDSATFTPAYYGPDGQPGSGQPVPGDAQWVEPGGATVWYAPTSYAYAAKAKRAPNTPPPVPSRCAAAVGWMLAGDPTPGQIAIISMAVLKASYASGQPYRYDGLSTEASRPNELVISVTSRANSDLLQVHGTADMGYALYSGTEMALLDTMPDQHLLPITLHELMLSRALNESTPDVGGMLGHIVPPLSAYPAQDVKLLTATGCR